MPSGRDYLPLQWVSLRGAMLEKLCAIARRLVRCETGVVFEAGVLFDPWVLFDNGVLFDTLSCAMPVMC